ncbi:hypothetical protein B1L11_31250 [Microbispora sp. GKU 823]|nr:hypothetical protein B1L11_31250 [Microbispora sp. GKU 823]
MAMEMGLGGSAADTFPTRPELQRLLPGYRLIRRLSQTPMSEVHLAEEVGLANRRVALKVLNPSVCDQPSFRERFHREVKSAARLGHPNVIPIHQAGEAGPLLYLVMPYVEGTDLAGLLRAEGPLGLARTARIIRQVAAALDAAHGKGLVHRDVKPHNILIDRDSGHVYLCDFGIAKHVADETSSAGQFIGTIDYASPEQIQGRKVDERTDVYSLGCVLYQCLTGRRPYPEPVPVSVMWAHLHAPPPRVTDSCPNLDSRIDDIVATALAKKPDDRFTGCAELAARLAEVVGAVPGPDLPAPPPPPPGSRGRRILTMLVATVPVIAIGVIVYVVNRDDLASAALARVPKSLQATCARAGTRGGFPGADISLSCRDGSGDEVVFGLFDTAADMDEAYEAAVREAGVVQGSGDCASADTGEHRYPGVGPPKGRVLCRTAGDTRSLIWTDTAARTVARAGMSKGGRAGPAPHMGRPPRRTAVPDQGREVADRRHGGEGLQARRARRPGQVSGGGGGSRVRSGRGCHRGLLLSLHRPARAAARLRRACGQDPGAVRHLLRDQPARVSRQQPVRPQECGDRRRAVPSGGRRRVRRRVERRTVPHSGPGVRYGPPQAGRLVEHVRHSLHGQGRAGHQRAGATRVPHGRRAGSATAHPGGVASQLRTPVEGTDSDQCARRVDRRRGVRPPVPRIAKHPATRIRRTSSERAHTPSTVNPPVG